MTIKKTLATLFVLSICGIYSQAQANTITATTCRLAQNTHHVALKDISTQDLLGHHSVAGRQSFYIELIDCPVTGPHKEKYISLRYAGDAQDLDLHGNLIPVQGWQTASGVALQLLDPYSLQAINLHNPDRLPKAALNLVSDNGDIIFSFDVQYIATSPQISPGHVKVKFPFEIIYK